MLNRLCQEPISIASSLWCLLAPGCVNGPDSVLQCNNSERHYAYVIESQLSLACSGEALFHVRKLSPNMKYNVCICSANIVYDALGIILS